jgi:hypothetical protein
MKVGALPVILIVLFALSAGCLSGLSTPPEPPAPLPLTTQPTTTSPVSSSAPSGLALQLTDIPGDYILKERSDIPYTTTTQIARDLGWRQGYSVTFYRVNPAKYDMTGLRQTIEFYPLANMNKVFDIAKEVMTQQAAGGQFSQNELPMEKIGDKSVAYITENTTSRNNLPVYTIIFVKKDVIEKLEMSGTTTDYETLKDLARVAADKIQ